MKKTIMAVVAALALGTTGMALSATTPSYSYVEGGYSHALQKNGATLDGSLNLTGPLFVTANYNVLGSNFQQVQGGVGLHVEPIQSVSLYAEAVDSLNKNRDESWRGNRNGYGAVGGIRWQASPALELDASAATQKLYGSQNQWTQSYQLGAVLALSDHVAVFARGTRYLNVHYADSRNANEWTGGVRLTF